MNVIETFIETRKELRDRGENVSKEVVATLTLAEAVLRVGHHLEMAIDGKTLAYAMTPSLANAIIDMDDYAFLECQSLSIGSKGQSEWESLVGVAEDLTGRETQANENARETQALADKLEVNSACEDDQ